MVEAGEFPTGLFGCCDVKDCGLPCCIKMCFCGNCNYGSAMEKAELGGCLVCCLCMTTPLRPCVGAYNRGRLAEKYNIDESMAMAIFAHCCCNCCAVIQDINLVITKENATWGCITVEPGAPPASEIAAS
ncbi:hypothetical protein CTAYLR_000154 [Chrysophaeum taylorii]|uniref:Uncharacterized protein n=1 Tax=Chrysophaeum taylorii TaxID=2483200 RepID=A0AAD7XM83_9STRA|nr:hypothetical protein CTAYLR_000154 [Chrysophaeum taylorii]